MLRIALFQLKTLHSEKTEEIVRENGIELKKITDNIVENLQNLCENTKHKNADDKRTLDKDEKNISLLKTCLKES